MTDRTNKLNAEFKRYIAELLTKKVKDPRITEMFTILEVNCDKELSSAKVYVSIFSTDVQRAAQTFAAIRENEPYIRREISKNMHTQGSRIPFCFGYFDGVRSKDKRDSE